jgi:arginase family enzyme
MKPSIKVIGVPDDINSSFMRGSSAAPPLIRKALYSDSSNLFSESGLNLDKDGVWEDIGDILLSGERAVENFKKIKSFVKGVIDPNQRLISLGGDHSISWPILDAHLDIWTTLDILHIDAHPDLYDNLLDNKLSHASPFARIMETGRANRTSSSRY